MMRLGVLSMKKDNERQFEEMIVLWNENLKQANEAVERLEQVRNQWQKETEIRLQRHEETKSTLDAIKTLLIEKVNSQEQSRQKKLEQQSRRLKKADKTRKSFKKERKRDKIEKGMPVTLVKRSSQV